MSDLKLIPFSGKNSGIVLAWRNSERIRENMLDDSVIEGASHGLFLKSVESDASRAYFVVELREVPVAAIYFSGLGSNKVTWGCYIGVEKTIPGLFVALLVIAAKYSFNLPSTKVLRSEVASYNASPIKMNRFLGIPELSRLARETSSGRNVDFIEYELSRDSLEDVVNKAKKIIPSSMKNACENIQMER